MSVDYYFVCGKCKQSIHVAHDGLMKGFTFFSGEPDCIQKLGKFLGDHSLCGEVRFVSEFEDVEDFDEIEWSTAGKAADHG